MASDKKFGPDSAVSVLVEALRTAAKGKAMPRRQFEALKKQGFLGGTHACPLTTAKGRAFVRAKHAPDDLASSINAPVMQLPDAMDRLANPRKGEAALVEPCDLAAAQRFQMDLQHAGLRQRITQSWSLAALDRSGSNSARSAPNEPVSMLDARERVNRACKVIGPEFSGLLIDICLFEKSLSGVERERRWPARSGKLAIALGLRALARHYGLTRTAIG
jgi:hypothetical protein